MLDLLIICNYVSLYFPVMVYPVEVLFAPRKSTIEVEVGSSYSIKNSTSLEPQKVMKTLSEEEKIQLEEGLFSLQAIQSSVKKKIYEDT